MGKHHHSTVPITALALTGLFDTHAHPTDGRFDSDRDDVLARMREGGMLCVCVGADMESSAQSVELAKREPMIYATVGVHPHDAKTFTEADVPVLTGLVYLYLLLPVGSFCSGLSLAKRQGFCPLYPLLCALCFLAAVPMVYNHTALPFCAVVLCAALLGELAGWLLGRRTS